MSTNDDYMLHEDGVFRVERFTNVFAVERAYPSSVRKERGIEVARYQNHLKVMIPIEGEEKDRIIEREQNTRTQRAIAERAMYRVVERGAGTYRVNRLGEEDRSYEVSSEDGWSCTCTDALHHRQILCKHAVIAMLHAGEVP